VSDYKKQADAIEKICRHHAERNGARLMSMDGHFVLRAPPGVDAFEVFFEKDGVFAAARVPLDASLERIDADAAIIVGTLRRQVECYRSGKYEPEIMGPTEKAWRVDRDVWLAKRGLAPPVVTPLVFGEDERVTAIDRKDRKYLTSGGEWRQYQ